MPAGCRSLLICLVLFAGCKNRDLVENELRARDIQFREAVAELGMAEARSNALQREVETLRKGAPISPEQAQQTFGLKRILLARSTSGYDNDGLPGDEALQVVVEPRDHDDHTIKTPGTLHILAMEITPQGIKAPIGSWVVEPDRLQRSWKQGLLSTGYTVVLAWKTFPRSENVRVIARLVLSDGRVFETDKDIRVRVVPGAPGRSDGPIECPPDAVDPLLLPVGHAGTADVSSVSFRPPLRPASQPRWVPVLLEETIRLGAPVPDSPPPPRPNDTRLSAPLPADRP